MLNMESNQKMLPKIILKEMDKDILLLVTLNTFCQLFTFLKGFPSKNGLLYSTNNKTFKNRNVFQNLKTFVCIYFLSDCRKIFIGGYTAGDRLTSLSVKFCATICNN